jgi:hypothetical protein
LKKYSMPACMRAVPTVAKLNVSVRSSRARTFRLRILVVARACAASGSGLPPTTLTICRI